MFMRTGYFYIILIVLLMVLLSGCNNAKRLPEDKLLLNKNEIEISNPEISKSEINRFIKQKPNKKLIGFFRFHLTVYFIGERIKKDNKIKKWLTESVGEKPVVLDTSMANNTTRQIEYYLRNKGYFNSNVKKTIDTPLVKKANVTYKIQANRPYRIRNVEYQVEDSTLKPAIEASMEKSLLRQGEIYSVEDFKNERERITSFLKNNGYYYFNKNFIEFQVDSTVGNQKLDVYMQVNNRVFKAEMYNDSLIALPHHQYKVRNVYIYPDYDVLQKGQKDYDTMRYEHSGKIYHYLYNGELPYKPEHLTSYVFMEPGEYYKDEEVKMTNQRLADLQQFKYVNIEFMDVHSDVEPWFRDTLPKKLDAFVRLTRTLQQSYTIEWLGKNTARDLGTEVSFVYTNKNLFKESEILNLNTNLSLETQQIISDGNNQNITKYLPFNTLEYGINADLDMPKFLLPVDHSRFPDYFKPRTTFSTGYNYRERPDYSRHLLNLSFGYRWDESETKQHQVYIADINSIKLNPDSSFIRRLNEIDNKKFLSAYEDHLIVGSKYNFIWNTQKARRKQNDFWYFRGTFEPAGLLLNTFASALNAEQDEDGNYELFNIRYAQYVRSEADFRYFYRFNKDNILASRFSLGVGIPYGNLNVLPFEKSFFVGGANGIRAWQLRNLGPGGFKGDQNDFDKTGDISLETSVEYRFPLYDMVHGALFVDAGNVWLKDKNTDFPNGQFKINRFYEQIAAGTGFGIRLDFSFFVIRVDAGIKVINPEREKGNKWVLDEYQLKKTNINFGIGYPF
ncbi:MAG: BamA/TamA family outer membrane protein [Bacteroidales bacterium]|nr:BamA/TamA family outer membrane protein [Bacteroidales bacterium]